MFSIRKAREIFWMLQHRTVFLYSLNDGLGNEFKASKREVLIDRKFPSLPKIRHRVGRGSHYIKAVFHPIEFIFKFNTFMISYKNLWGFKKLENSDNSQ